MNKIWSKEESAGLLKWYKKEKISYPWTGESDGYRVLVGELMLQQTVAATVIPKYSAWLKRFPDFFSLANSDEETVLRLWEGLGYYARAKNLRKIAITVVRDHDGKLPDSEEALRSLPGIGEYTASALLSFVYGKKIAVFDANVRRILSRFFAKEESTPQWESHMKKMLTEAVPSGKSADFNSALMQFGQKVCVSRSPLCSQCFLLEKCQAAKKGLQESIPPSRKMAVIRFSSQLLLCLRGKKILLCRSKKGRFSHQWRFPRVAVNGVTVTGVAATTIADTVTGAVVTVNRVTATIGPGITKPFIHTYTKYCETLIPCFVTEKEIVYDEAEEYRWADLAELEDLAFPSSYRVLVRKLDSILT